MPDTISIIIPMRNEEKFVGTCLNSVLNQLDALPQCEVLCVDGASTDKTRELILQYSTMDPRVKLVDNPQRIVPTGMNSAIQRSRGDIIIRLDCHARYAPDYFRNCIDVLKRTGADNVGGYIDTVPSNDSRTSRSIAAASSSRFGVGGSTFRTGGGEQEVDTVPFGCFRPDVFDRFGMYDERLVRNQDIELNSRIRRGGGKIIISPLIRLTYYTRSTFAGLRQQAFNNGLWNPYTLYLVGGGLRFRHLIPLFFILSIIILAAVSTFFQPSLYLLAVEIFVYLIVGISLSFPLARKANTSPWLVFLSFIQLHFAYGTGSLWGLITAPFKFGLKPKRAFIGQAIANRRN